MLAVSSGNEEARLWSLTLVEQSASAVHQATLAVFGKSGRGHGEGDKGRRRW